MTTLLSQHDSGGLVGRCDARCYNAKTKHCKCICHGRNHGIGRAAAIDNAREIFLEARDTPPQGDGRVDHLTLTPSKVVIESCQQNFLK